MALGSVGGMQAAFERTVELVRDAAPGGDRQAVRHRLAEMAVTIEAGRDLTYHALRLPSEGIDAIREVTMAKLATQRASFDLMDACLQIHADPRLSGAVTEAARRDIERGARDSRLGPIGGRTADHAVKVLGKTVRISPQSSARAFRSAAAAPISACFVSFSHLDGRAFSRWPAVTRARPAWCSHSFRSGPKGPSFVGARRRGR